MTYKINYVILGVYYESNGHGTVLFNEVNLSNLESFIVMIEKDNEKLSPEVLDFINSAKQLALILRMSNQVFYFLFVEI